MPPGRKPHGPPKTPAKRKPALNPATAPFKPGTDSFTERQRQARARHVKLIQGPAKPKGAPQVQPKQVGSMFGLEDAGAGLGHSKAPAKRNVPNLTDQVALAKARKQRLEHGGLLTAPQRTAETQASRGVETKTNFATPPPGSVALPPRAPVATPTREGRVAGRSGTIYHGEPKPESAFGGVGEFLGKNVLAPAHEVADRAWATGLWNAATIPGTLFTPPKPGAHPPVEDVHAVSSAEASSKLLHSQLKRPNVTLPAGWLNLEGTAYAGAKPSTRIPFADLEGTGFGLSPQGKAALTHLALKVQHWNPGDIEDLPATDFIYKAYNPPPNLLTRIGLGAANDVLLGGSQTVGMLGGVSEIAQGRGGEFAKGLAHQLGAIAPVVGRHPFGQELLTHPLFAATALHGGLKSAGNIGHVLPRIPGERNIPIKVKDSGDANLVVNRGPRNRNLWTAAANEISDLHLKHSPRAAEKVGKKIVDQAITDIRDGIAPEHIALQVPYKQGMDRIKPQRAEELMAHAAWGGTPGLEAGAAHFSQTGRQDWAEFLSRAAESTKTLSENDKAYLDSLHKISGHTSDIRGEKDLQLHGDLAQLYRRYELPIEHSATLGDAKALNAIEKRDAYEEVRQGTQSDQRHSAGVLAEVERQAKAAEAEYGRYERAATSGSADHAQWTLEGKQIRAERPRLPKLEETNTFPTLKEASAAAKGVEGAKVSKTDEGFVVDGLPKAKHPPGTMGPHRAAVKEWKARYKEYQAREPKVSKGREHSAAAKMRAARSRADQLNARAESLRKGNPISHEDALAAAEGQYRQAVNDFVDSHLSKPGATEAAYIPYTKPPSGLRRVVRTAGKQRFTPKLDREHRSTGETARTGEFMLDPRAPLHANAEAQRLRANVGVFRLLEHHPFVERVTGDGKLVVPEGKIAVPITNMRSTVETQMPWSEVPVGMHELHERETKVRDAIFKAFGRDKQNAGEEIPVGKEVFLIPKGMHDRIEEWAKPGTSQGFFGAYDRANQAYQRLLIGIYPSTWLGNAPGSVPLAIASGAVHPMDYVRAAQSGRQGPISSALGLEKHSERSPASISGMGPAAGITAGSSINPVMWLARKGRAASMLGEDFSARAAYYGQARPYVEGRLPTLRKMAPALDKIMPAKWKGKAAELNASAADVYHALATGKWGDEAAIPPELKAKRDAMLDHVADFVSASGKPIGGKGKVVGRVVLFQSWIGHILKLSLITLPITHPRRATLLNTVALYGNQYRQEHGVYPGWMLQFFPLLRQSRTINGESVPGVLSGGLGQLTPISSAANLAQAGSSLGTGNEGPITAAAGVLSPVLQPFVQAALQMEKNAQAGPGTQTYNPAAVGFASLVYGAPGLSKFAPRSGYDPTSNPLTGMNRRHYYEYVQNPSGRSYKRYEIPWEMRPGGRPIGGALGTFSRWGGIPLEWSPTGGAPFNIETSNAQIINQTKATQREIKEALKRK